MAIDASIYNLANRPSTQLMSYGDLMQQKLGIDQARQNQEMGQMELAQKRQQMADAEMVRKIGELTQGDPQKMSMELRKLGRHDMADRIDNSLAERNAKAASEAEKRMKIAKDLAPLQHSIYSQVKDQASWDAAKSQLEANAKQFGLDTSVNNHPAQYDPAFVQSELNKLRAFLPEEKPLTDLAKLESDFKAGRISPEDYKAAKKKALTINAGVTINTGEKLPPGWRLDPENPGSWKPIPGGPHDPAAPGKPLTEAQGNALGFGIRAREADTILSDLESKGTDAGSLKNKTLGQVPLLGNYIKSESVQKYEQAQRNFVTAVLRKESGAAISAAEFDTEAKKYFPQPGDSPAVLRQKAEARKTAIEVLQVQAGRELPEVVKPVKPVKAESKTPQSTKVGTKAMLEAWMRDNPTKKRSEGIALMKQHGYSTEGL